MGLIVDDRAAVDGKAAARDITTGGAIHHEVLDITRWDHTAGVADRTRRARGAIQTNRIDIDQRRTAAVILHVDLPAVTGFRRVIERDVGIGTDHPATTGYNRPAGAVGDNLSKGAGIDVFLGVFHVGRAAAIGEADGIDIHSLTDACGIGGVYPPAVAIFR